MTADLPPIPWGHSISAHLLLGFCAKCPGRNLPDEVVAWRGWAVTNLPAVYDAVGRYNEPDVKHTRGRFRV